MPFSCLQDIDDHSLLEFIVRLSVIVVVVRTNSVNNALDIMHPASRSYAFSASNRNYITLHFFLPELVALVLDLASSRVPNSSSHTGT